jgi:hypothetical protein
LIQRGISEQGCSDDHPFFKHKFQITSTNIQNPNGQYKKVLNLGIGILNLFGICLLAGQAGISGFGI